MSRTGKGLIGLGRAILVFAISAASICLVHERPVLLALLLAVTAAFMFVISEDKRNAVTVGTIGAILGTVGEIFAVRFGAWRYPAPFVLGIPMWLPFAWGLITMVILDASASVTQVLKSGGRSGQELQSAIPVPLAGHGNKVE